MPFCRSHSSNPPCCRNDNVQHTSFTNVFCPINAPVLRKAVFRRLPLTNVLGHQYPSASINREFHNAQAPLHRQPDWSTWGHAATRHSTESQAQPPSASCTGCICVVSIWGVTGKPDRDRRGRPGPSHWTQDEVAPRNVELSPHSGRNWKTQHGA